MFIDEGGHGRRQGEGDGDRVVESVGWRDRERGGGKVVMGLFGVRA